MTAVNRFVWGAVLLLGVVVSGAHSLAAKELASVETHKGHRILEVYTPVAHAKGHTFAVMPDKNDRPVVMHAAPDGKVTQRFLDDGADYVAFPDGHNGFSLGIDPQGYIHITGDMHQFGARHSRPGKYPYPARYDDKKDAVILYWRSVKPWDIAAGFEFWGDKSSPHKLPGNSWSYGRFFNDRDGVLYYSSRVRSFWPARFNVPHPGKGNMALGLYRYDAETEKWEALGGLVDPGHDNYRQRYKVLFWTNSGRADTGESYQVYQSHFAFDAKNRLHLTAHAMIGPENRSRICYAYSDDRGATWHKADGTPIAGLPLRGEDGVPNQADVVQEGGSGIIRVVADRHGRPAINQGHSYRGSNVWNGEKWEFRTDVPGHRGHILPSGDILLTSAWATWRVNEFARDKIQVHETKGGLNTVCPNGVFETGKLYGLGVNKEGTRVALEEKSLDEK